MISHAHSSHPTQFCLPSQTSGSLSVQSVSHRRVQEMCIISPSSPWNSKGTEWRRDRRGSKRAHLPLVQMAAPARVAHKLNYALLKCERIPLLQPAASRSSCQGATHNKIYFPPLHHGKGTTSVLPLSFVIDLDSLSQIGRAHV